MKNFLLILSVLIIPNITAQSFVMNGLNFEVTSTTAKTVQVLPDVIPYTGNIIVPAVVSYQSIDYSVTHIGNCAFKDCLNLTSVIIPSSVTTVGDNAFYGDTNLTAIAIPNSVTALGLNEFAGCSSMKKISVLAAVPPYTPCPNTFGFINKTTCILEVPVGSKTAYQTTSYWSQLQNIVEVANTGLSTDTIHRIITDFQSDSLINVNRATAGFYILDVRTPAEFNTGHLIGANIIDYRATNFSVEINKLDRNIIYLVYCKGGSRSLPTYNQMIALHFREVYMMNGGFDQWKVDGLPYETSIVSNTEILIAPEQTLNVYPNPANQNLTLDIKNPIKNATLSIVNANGQEVIKQQITNTHFMINVSQLQHGFYFVKVTDTNGIQVAKFLKN